MAAKTAAVALAVAAACLWGASRLTWVRVSAADGLGPQREIALAGSTWFGALTPLALVLVASIAALFAAKGRWRQLVGVVIAVIGGATAVPALTLITHAGVTAGRAHALAELPGRARVTELHPVAGPAVLALTGALLAFVAGVWLARKPAGTGLSGRYDAPAVRRTEAARRTTVSDGEQVSQRVLWDAIDAGDDPTDPDSSRESTTKSVGGAAVGNTPGEKPGPDGLYS